MLYCIIIPAACKGVFSHFCTTSVLAVGGAVCYTDNNYEKIQKPQEEMTVKQSLSFARRLTALVLAAVMLCVAVPAAFAEDAAPGATTIGGANTTLIPEEEENCLSWLFGSKDKITLPYLNIKGKGLRRNVSLDLVDCLVGITYTELGSIGSYVSASAAQEAWKAQAVAIHSYLEYHKQYGSSANALIYTPVEDIPSSARSAIRKAVESVKDEVLTCNGSVIDAVWSASAGYNTQTGIYGTCSSLDAWGSDVPYLKSVESPMSASTTRRCAASSARIMTMSSTTTAAPVSPTRAPTPPTKTSAALSSTIRWCPMAAATAISASSCPPATASISARMQRVYPVCTTTASATAWA